MLYSNKFSLNNNNKWGHFSAQLRIGSIFSTLVARFSANFHVYMDVRIGN